ncbi:hypothetical protein [Streptomyces sp. enrichment culture]
MFVRTDSCFLRVPVLRKELQTLVPASRRALGGADLAGSVADHRAP